MKRLAFALVALLAWVPAAAFAEGEGKHVAFHVDQNDPKLMNLTLNNVRNVTAYYEAQGIPVYIEVVAYGPGLNMLIDGKSPVADRISVMGLEMENVTFAACANTMNNMKKKTGKDVMLLEEATIVPSGVVRLIELQEQGWAYIRP